MIDICKEHGLLFVGSEKKLSKVIEAYFNGEIIHPHRNWYTNKLLLSFVNENGLSLKLDFVLLGVSLIFTVIGIINKINYAESVAAVLFLVFGVTGLFVAFVSFIEMSRKLQVTGMCWESFMKALMRFLLHRIIFFSCTKFYTVT